MSDVFIVDAVRTPVGKLGGALATTRPDDLAATVVRALAGAHRDRSSRSTRSTSATPTRPARTTATSRAWPCCSPACPTSVPGATVNRLCGSGMEAVFSASRAIAAGDEAVCVAGGVESMSRAPWVVLKPEKPFPRTQRDDALDHARLAHGQPEDARRVDGLARRGRRDPRRPVRHHARAAGRVRAREPPAGRRGVGARARSRDEVVPVPGVELRARREHPRRQHAREARAAQAGVPQGRHGHGGQLVADERRRRRRCCSTRRGATGEPLARIAAPRRRARSSRSSTASARSRRRTRRSSAPASAGATSPRSSSTRRSRRSRSPASPSGRSSTRRS